MRVAVIGAGSWGTALSLILARNGHEVTLVGRSGDTMDQLATLRENLRYLPGFPLPENIEVTTAIDGRSFDLLIEAVPSGTVAENLPLFGAAPTIVIASKGLAPDGDGLLSDDVQAAHPTAEVVVLSGPNLARELAMGIPTAAVAASPNLTAAERVRAAFMNPTYRVYVSEDRKGVELAGALKNVMAIGAGVCDGLGYGDNTKGAFLARGLSEIAKLGMTMGARLETFLGIAGVGDLFATASSKLSRNYRVGYGLGEGRRLDEILLEIGQVAEGVPTCGKAVQLARLHGVPVTIMETLQEVIKGRLRARDAVGRLMERNTPGEGLTLPSDGISPIVKTGGRADRTED